MLNRENKTAITRKGMVSNRLNKFSIRKYTVGTASILVGTTLIFGLGNQEAKAAESTNKELNEATTSASDNQSSDKVDMQQLKTILKMIIKKKWYHLKVMKRLQMGIN